MRNGTVMGGLTSGIWLIFASISLANSKSASPEALNFFESKIRPVFARYCYDCHGADEQSSDLRLDTAEGIFRGGKAGPAVVAGDPEQSLIVSAIGHRNPDLMMPPEEKLSAADVANIKKWIEDGAAYPGPMPKSLAAKPGLDVAKAKQFWSFQTPTKPAVPKVQDSTWAQTEIDRFILSALEAKQLAPADAADKRTLIRRATMDLLGLPPTPEEIDAFLSDDAPNAFAKVVDRLLASPQYGEHWGRHWLDVARYADSNGMDENLAFGNAWRYRDYVIAAFNKDKPFNQFVMEQIAGDLLPPVASQAVERERLTATAFLSMGPKVLAEPDLKKFEMDIVDEQIDTVGRAFLGLTLGCARCHDHKFDPITADDYYALAGIFKSTRTMSDHKVGVIATWYEHPLDTQTARQQKQELKANIAAKQKTIADLIAKANTELLAKLKATTLPKGYESQYAAETKKKLDELRAEVAKLKKTPVDEASIMGVTEGTPTDVRIHVRGSHMTLGKLSTRHVPAVLANESAPTFTNESSGRLELAQWLTRPDHPLVGRVIVNRIWRWHFGQGLVKSTDNFGKLGDAPSNLELLNWLALQFVEDGWSIKTLHRRIMLSSVYQQASRNDNEAVAAKAGRVDPENLLLWKMNVRRLEAESIRDSILAVSGALDRSMGGTLLHVKTKEFLFNHTSMDGTKYDVMRRSIYLPVIRNNMYDVFQLFDYADSSTVNGSRESTTVAPQALFMMNSELVVKATKEMATRILISSAKNDDDRIARLHLTTYGRLPTAKEIARANDFLNRFDGAATVREPDAIRRRLLGWQTLCQVMIAANEFVYVQ